MGYADHTLETNLLVECSRTSFPDSVSDRISSALKQRVDWRFVLNVAQRNAILPLVGRTLCGKFSKQIPEEIRSILEKAQIDHLHRNLFLTSKLVELVRLFRSNGIEVLPFKGPLLAVEAYGDPALRQFYDLDMLVKPKQFRDAVSLLTDRGWKPMTSVSWLTKRDLNISRKKDIYFVDPDRKVNLELHWKLSGSHFGLPREINTLWERLELIELAGTELPSLGFIDQLIYLCLHGSRHSWERFGWICDIHQLVLSKDRIDWIELFARSRKLGSENVVALGLRLIQDFFGFKITDPEWERVLQDPIFAEMSAEIRDRLFKPALVSVDIAERYKSHLKLKERSFDRFKLHYHYLSWYARIILTPNEADRSVLGLPRTLDGLYYLTRPVRLLYTYVLRSNEQKTSRPEIQP